MKNALLLVLLILVSVAAYLTGYHKGKHVADAWWNSTKLPDNKAPDPLWIPNRDNPHIGHWVCPNLWLLQGSPGQQLYCIRYGEGREY